MGNNNYDALRQSLADIASCEATAVNAILRSIEDGVVLPSSTPGELRQVSGAKPQISDLLSCLVSSWDNAGGTTAVSPSSISLALASASTAVSNLSHKKPHIELVWSGPRTGRKGIRSTSEVIKDIVRTSHHRLFIVGYAMTSADLVEQFVQAIRRDVRMTMILHNDMRNRNALRKLWPLDVELPRLLTWTQDKAHKMAKMHIKLVLGDGKSVLVTSANITHLAMNENMELGVYITGDFVGSLTKHFDGLEQQGLLKEINIGQG